MSWWEDVQEVLMNKMDGGKEEREWDKTVAMLARTVDDMCERYLVQGGGSSLEFEVSPDKQKYMAEVLADKDLNIKYDIKQKSPTIYEAVQRSFEF